MLCVRCARHGEQGNHIYPLQVPHPVAVGTEVQTLMQVVLVPVALGAWLNMSFPRVMKRLSPFAPLLAASMTILISASIVAQNAVAIRSPGLRLVFAVVSLHLGQRHSS